MFNSKTNKIDTLNKLIQCFFNGSLNFSLEPEEAKLFTWEKQEMFLNATVYKEAVKKYPVSNEFCRLFFKKLIQCLEPHQEIHDDFYTCLCTVLNNSSEQGYCYRHYIVRNNLNNMITIKETKNMVVNGTTGMRTWQAALMLADWAISNENIFRSKNILELGCGVGFTGITITKHCDVKSIVLTDCHEDVLRTICDNIQINFSDIEKDETSKGTFFKEQHRKIGVMNLDWNCIEDLPEGLIPDVLIGADIIYDPSILKPLCNVIKSFFNKNRHLEVYFANIIRNEDTYKSFIELLESMDLSYEEISLTKSMLIQWDNSIEKCFLKIELK